MLHPFDPRSQHRSWLPADYTPDTWPVFDPAPVGNHRQMATVSHLYRFYGAEQDLLYVGVTVNPVRRWMVHRAVADWWPLARFVAIESIPPVGRLEREQQAIDEGRPRFNSTRPFGRSTY